MAKQKYDFDLIVLGSGIVGAFVAGWLFPSFWPMGGMVGAIIHAALGAIIVLFVVGLIKRA